MRRVMTLLLTVLALAACSNEQTGGLVGAGELDPAGRGGTSVGAVYASNNAAGGNAVIAFDRAADGSLTPAGVFPTGGTGTGVGLGSQGAVILSDDARLLFVVNAGSNTVTSFQVDKRGLTRVDEVASGGVAPVSVTFHRDLLYVLNAGAAPATAGNITGFRVDHSGDMTPLAGSTRPLSGNGFVAPAQVSFSPAGDVLVVTEKATNLIDTYTVGADGTPSQPIVHESVGITPFGFGFNKRDQLIVSEAFAIAGVPIPGESAVSSYLVDRDGDLEVVSGSVKDGQSAACWIVVTNDHKTTFTSNTASGNISSYRIAADGSLTLDQPVAGITGGAPTDMAISRNSKFLYALDEADGEVHGFSIAGGGLLTLGAVSVPELSAFAVGLAAH